MKGAERVNSRIKGASRRSFLGAAVVSVGTLAAASLLTGCDGRATDGARGAAKATPTGVLTGILPAYIPSSLVPPDIPSVYGSDPGYLSYPTDLVRTVSEIPGVGSTFTAVTPLWGAMPEANGNRYYAAVNRALGASLTLRPAPGSGYQDTLTKAFTGGAVPDWIQVPAWNVGPVGFGRFVEPACADLTPYLSSHNIQKYPNLASISSNAWQAGVWNGKLFGIPVYSNNISLIGALYYRKDFFAAKGLAEPKSADEFFALGKDLTDARAGRWAFDNLWTYLDQPFDLPAAWTTDDKGGIVHRFELDRCIAAVELMARMVKAGYMHPDAMTSNIDEAKRRFASGAVAIYGDGTGAWHEQVESQARAGNTAFQMQAMAVFNANGTGKPRCALGNGAVMFSYLNRNLPRAKIEEALRLANYIAAPYGSIEYTLINYGEQGLHHTVEAAGPQLTETGAREVATTYQFLATGPGVTAIPGHPDWVKAYTAWQGNAAQYAYKPPFFGLNVVEPPEYSAINNPVEAVLKDVIQGRRTTDDFRSVVAAWRRQGGDTLRTFYMKARDQYGTGG